MVHKYIHKSILLMPAKNCIFGGNCSLKKCILRTLVSLQDTRNSYYCPTPKKHYFHEYHVSSNTSHKTKRKFQLLGLATGILISFLNISEL